MKNSADDNNPWPSFDSPTLGYVQFDHFNEIPLVITPPASETVMTSESTTSIPVQRKNKRKKASNNDIDDEKERKRKARLEKNKLNSKLSRQRQKEYIKSLEQKVQQLQTENVDLKAQLEVSVLRNAPRVTSSNKNDDVVSSMTTSNGGNTTDLYAEGLKKLKEFLSQHPNSIETNREAIVELRELSNKLEALDYYGQSRLNEVTYHMQRIAQLLVPLPHSKFALWGLTQDDSFYDTSSQHSGIFHSAAVEMKATTAQLQRLKEQREAAKGCIAQFDESIKLLKQLHSSVDEHVKRASIMFKKIRTLLEPHQIANYVLWIEKNQALISMLNSMLVVNTSDDDKNVALQHSTNPLTISKSLKL